MATILPAYITASSIALGWHDTGLQPGRPPDASVVCFTLRGWFTEKLMRVKLAQVRSMSPVIIKFAKLRDFNTDQHWALSLSTLTSLLPQTQSHVPSFLMVLGIFGIQLRGTRVWESFCLRCHFHVIASCSGGGTASRSTPPTHSCAQSPSNTAGNRARSHIAARSCPRQPSTGSVPVTRSLSVENKSHSYYEKETQCFPQIWQQPWKYAQQRVVMLKLFSKPPIIQQETNFNQMC